MVGRIATSKEEDALTWSLVYSGSEAHGSQPEEAQHFFQMTVMTIPGHR
jgi:hypothetical protein